MSTPPKIILPVADARLGQHRDTRLADALSKVVLAVKAPGTDITHGVTFYTPVVTLLAGIVGTRRQDLVYSAWPVLGCPYHYFDTMLPSIYATDINTHRKVSLPLKQMLDTHMLQASDGKCHVLWEIIDMLQAMCGWNLKQIITWTRDVENMLRREHAGLLIQLQSMADEVVSRHDAEGMLDKKPGLTEGVVFPADGPGRVN